MCVRMRAYAIACGGLSRVLLLPVRYYKPKPKPKELWEHDLAEVIKVRWLL